MMYFEAKARSSSGTNAVMKRPAEVSGWSVRNLLPIDESVGVNNFILAFGIRINAKISSFQVPRNCSTAKVAIPEPPIGRTIDQSVL